MHRLFFQVANESVTVLGEEEVTEEVEIVEDSLSKSYHKLEQCFWLLLFQEYKQMSSLILSLF